MKLIIEMNEDEVSSSFEGTTTELSEAIVQVMLESKTLALAFEIGVNVYADCLIERNTNE